MQYERCNGKIKTSYLDKQLLRTTAGEREGKQTNGKWTCRLPQRALAHSKPEDKTKLHGLSPRANYTDRAAAAGRRS
jgi:hypothetical protein